jgi:hypothetical protein
MEGQFTYQDFDLLIEPDPDGGYRARVLRSPAGESAPARFTLPFSTVELENFVLKVGQPRRRTRGPGRPESAPLKDFGGKLYGAVFHDELRDTLLRSLAVTRAQGGGMRLRLRLTDTPELAELPWEFLYDPRHRRFLAQSRRTPLVRYLDLPDPPQPLSVEGPLRVLVMISNPSDYPELDVEQEWSLLTGALAGQQAEGRVVIERMAANMSTLQDRLSDGGFHVFHFVGHGYYRPDWGDGVLVMEDRHGRPQEVTGEDLGVLLTEYDPTRLAVLNACEGARSGTSDPFAGVAQSLIQQGLPAVVAMQFEITDDAAIIFSHELYATIASGYPLEAALAQARRAILYEGNPTEWGTPVLYSRAPDGHLFDLTRQAPILDPYGSAQEEEEADRQAQEEADRQAQEEADRQAQEEADRQAQEEADRQAQEEAERTERLESGHQTALRQIDTGNLREAIVTLERVVGLAPPDHPAVAVLDRARRQLAEAQSPAGGPHTWQVDQPVCALAFSPDGTSLAAGARGMVRVWSLHTAAAVRELPVGRAKVVALAFSPDGTRLAGGAGWTARIWDATTGEQQLEVTHGRSDVLAVAFSPDGTRLATGSSYPYAQFADAYAGTESSARIWDATTGEQQLEMAHSRRSEVLAVAFSPDGTRLATGTNDKTARIWDITDG